jgi:hypothetical protein
MDHLTWQSLSKQVDALDEAVRDRIRRRAGRMIYWQPTFWAAVLGPIAIAYVGLRVALQVASSLVAPGVARLLIVLPAMLLAAALIVWVPNRLGQVVRYRVLKRVYLQETGRHAV